MEKSIESIWEKGFLNKEDLVAPRLVNLYNQKSNDLVDKYKRMFRLNLKALFIGSFVVLILSFTVRLPYMGVPMFLILQWLVFMDKKLLVELEKIDKHRNSYEYLKNIDRWMTLKTKENIGRARIFYPYFFLSMVLGFWFMQLSDNSLGEEITHFLQREFPNTLFVFGVPLLGLFLVIAAAVAISIFAKRIYLADINSVYGPIIKKLRELIADMEELRKE